MADIIFPAFFIEDSSLSILIIPLILVEYLIMKYRLPNMKRKCLLKVTTISNLVSTIVGYPVVVISSMFLGLAVELTTINLKIGKYVYITRKFLFAIIVVIGAFFLSYIIELLITMPVLRKKEQVDEYDVGRAVWWANIASYAFLVIVGIILEIYCNYTGRKSFFTIFY
jgi:hypothetical protein